MSYDDAVSVYHTRKRRRRMVRSALIQVAFYASVAALPWVCLKLIGAI
jgi:hypothetical protein